MEKFKILDLDSYYRKDVYRHFTKDCKCSVSITKRIDVTELIKVSKEKNIKFYINFLYCLAKTLNSRDDYKTVYDWQNNQLKVYDKLHITHYVFDKTSETCTPVYTKYNEIYDNFYLSCYKDIEYAKKIGGYNLDSNNHINYFDASYISWISYDSLNIELPDGYLYFQPIINWGRYREENGRFLMPLTVRLNHAIGDGYLVSYVFTHIEENINELINEIKNK